MERLTDKKSRNPIPGAQGGLCVTAEFIRRLAAYEDTGLEPCDYSAMRAAINQSAEYKKQLSDVVNILGCSDIEHLKDIFQAEKDGRLVVLPVPVGSGKVAYGLYDPDDAPQRITTIECDYLEKLEIWDNPGHEVVIEVDGWEIGESDIGKTVFLTREEAEAALKKREADNEAD